MRSCSVASSSPSRTSTARWATTGPVSMPASTRWTVQPVTRTPYASASRTACAPGKAGSSAGWVFSDRERVEDRRAEQPHEPGRDDEPRVVLGDRLGQRLVPVAAAARSRRARRRTSGTPAASARASPRTPSRSAADGGDDHAVRRVRCSRRAGPAGWSRRRTRARRPGRAVSVRRPRSETITPSPTRAVIVQFWRPQLHDHLKRIVGEPTEQRRRSAARADASPAAGAPWCWPSRASCSRRRCCRGGWSGWPWRSPRSCIAVRTLRRAKAAGRPAPGAHAAVVAAGIALAFFVVALAFVGVLLRRVGHLPDLPRPGHHRRARTTPAGSSSTVRCASGSGSRP